MTGFTQDEMERAKRMAFELRNLDRTRDAHNVVRVELSLFDIFRVIGGLQLATRHPTLPPTVKAALESFARQLQREFDTPETQELARTLEQGWHTEFDR